MNVFRKIIFIVAIIISIFASIYYLRYYISNRECDIFTLSRENGNGLYDAIAEHRICGGIGGSSDVIISIVRKETGERFEVFRYSRSHARSSSNRDDNDPLILWRSSDILYIEIDEVSFVLKRADNIEGVKIYYSSYNELYH